MTQKILTADEIQEILDEVRKALAPQDDEKAEAPLLINPLLLAA